MSRRNKSPKAASDKAQGETTGRQGEECYAYTHTLAEQARARERHRRHPVALVIVTTVITPPALKWRLGRAARRASVS